MRNGDFNKILNKIYGIGLMINKKGLKDLKLVKEILFEMKFHW